MFMMPPRPTFLSAKRWSVGQNPPPAAPTPAAQMSSPSQGAGGSEQSMTQNEIRNIIRQELQRHSATTGAEEETPTTGWGAFWTGMWDWLKGASGELITAGATVFITLYARELYAQSRLPEQQSARVALDLATPETDFEKMTVEQLETETDKLISDFYADDPPTNLQIGQRLQVVLELLISKKEENLATVNQAIEEAEDDDEPAIIERETSRGEALAEEIINLEEDWEEVTNSIEDLIKRHPEVEKFEQVRRKYKG